MHLFLFCQRAFFMFLFVLHFRNWSFCVVHFIRLATRLPHTNIFTHNNITSHCLRNMQKPLSSGTYELAPSGCGCKHVDSVFCAFFLLLKSNEYFEIIFDHLNSNSHFAQFYSTRPKRTHDGIRRWCWFATDSEPIAQHRRSDFLTECRRGPRRLGTIGSQTQIIPKLR